MQVLHDLLDNVGSVTAITNASAQVVWKSEYQPFGTTAGIQGTYEFDGGYTGKDVDDATGLIYMWHRWQDPNTGSFISEDPIRDGNNWYGYCGGNAVSRFDATGLAMSYRSKEGIYFFASSLSVVQNIFDSAVSALGNIFGDQAVELGKGAAGFKDISDSDGNNKLRDLVSKFAGILGKESDALGLLWDLSGLSKEGSVVNGAMKVSGIVGKMASKLTSAVNIYLAATGQNEVAMEQLVDKTVGLSLTAKSHDGISALFK